MIKAADTAAVRVGWSSGQQHVPPSPPRRVEQRDLLALQEALEAGDDAADVGAEDFEQTGSGVSCPRLSLGYLDAEGEPVCTNMRGSSGFGVSLKRATAEPSLNGPAP